METPNTCCITKNRWPRYFRPFSVGFVFWLASCTSPQPKDARSIFEPPPDNKSYLADPTKAPEPPNTSWVETEVPMTQSPGLPSTTRKTILVVGGKGVLAFALIGVLKRLKLEGIGLDAIYATHEPAVFAVGYGMMKSIHDLEWFASRLETDDLANPKKVTALLEKQTPLRDLNDLKTSTVIVVNERETYDNGSWSYPLQRTLENSAEDGFPFAYDGELANRPHVLFLDLYENYCAVEKYRPKVCLSRMKLHRELKANNALLLRPSLKEIKAVAGKQRLQIRRAILSGFEQAKLIIKRIKE